MAKFVGAGKYEDVKAAIKAEMESKGKKYPTNTNGLSEEFIIKTFGDRLWAESVTAWETYYCYGVGMSIEDAEDVLNDMWITVMNDTND